MKNTILFIVAMFLLSGCTFGTSPTGQTTNDNKPPLSVEKKDVILDLSYKNLTEVEMSVFEENNLEELNISFNRLTGALPSQIGQLKGLKILKANDNKMTGVPAEIGQLINLEILDLSNNQLTGLPNELKNLKNLKTLNLSGNNYSEQDLKVIRDNLPNVNYILQ